MCNKFYATTLYKEFRIIRTPSRTYRLISDHDKNNITNSTVNKTKEMPENSRKYEQNMKKIFQKI